MGSTSTRLGSFASQPPPAIHEDDEYHLDEEEGEEHEYPEVEGSTSLEFWMRGPVNLPPKPTREEDKTVIVPVGDM